MIYFPSLLGSAKMGGLHSCSRRRSNAACSSIVGGQSFLGSEELTNVFKGFATLAKAAVKLRYTVHIPRTLRSCVCVFGYMAFLIAFRFFSFALMRPGRMT